MPTLLYMYLNYLSFKGSKIAFLSTCIIYLYQTIVQNKSGVFLGFWLKPRPARTGASDCTPVESTYEVATASESCQSARPVNRFVAEKQSYSTVRLGYLLPQFSSTLMKERNLHCLGLSEVALSLKNKSYCVIEFDRRCYKVITWDGENG
jgi:hypothetical protein